MSKHYPMVQAVCQDCGETVWITSNSSGRFKRCPECRAQALIDKSKNRIRVTTVAYECHVGGAYHVSKDPDGSWSCDSSMTLDEIEKLLSMRYLAIGTEFRLEPSKVSTHRVVRERGILVLRLISELDKVPAPKKKPYWRSKQCLSTTV